MRLFRNRKVRCRKRSFSLFSSLPEINPSTGRCRIMGSSLLVSLLILLQFTLLLFGVAVNGEGISSSGSASLSFISSATIFSSFSNLGALVVIYSALPYYATAKSIRQGKEVQEEDDDVLVALLSNVSTTTTTPSPSSNQTLLVASSSSVDENSTIFSSRTLFTSEEENIATTTLTPSEEMEVSLDDSSEEERKRKRERRKGMDRLKRQMGVAAEIALIAPALQTMGCIPKFFCGLNSKPPTHESSTINDLAYLIKFAMLDDDDIDFDDPIFAEKTPNIRGKDGLTRIKEDLIIENMAEEEMIQEDPANLPFVWQDMEHRIKSKTKPGSKLRVEDVMDEIIIEPEQSAVGSLVTGIKSVLRIGRSVDHLLQGQGNDSSQGAPRSGRLWGRTTVGGSNNRKTDQINKRRLRWRERWRKQPFWATPQFRQDMELAERIGKIEQDENKCSTTFNVCPYTVHEMSDIVHGGYKKKQERKKKKKPQWYVNANGPPQDSSEEVKKPFNDPENLVTTTTTTEKVWHLNDPENQIYYALYPHKAMEKGLTTVPTTRRPRPNANREEEDKPEIVYDIGPRPPLREHRRPPMNIQGHVEYENDEASFEGKRPEHMEMMVNNQHQQVPQPPGKSSWWNLIGGGNKRPQSRPPHPQHHPHPHPPPKNQIPARRPHPGMQKPERPPHKNQPMHFAGGMSAEGGNKSGNDDDLGDSSEEEGKRKKQKKKKGTSSSDSVEDEEGDGTSSEEKTPGKRRRRPDVAPPVPYIPPPSPPTPAPAPVQLPPELQGDDPNIRILSIQPIENGGDLVPTGVPQQHEQMPQPLQPFFQDVKQKQNPIQPPRQKYVIHKERKQKRKKIQPPQLPPVNYETPQQPPQPPPSGKLKQSNPDKKEDKSNEASDEDEEDDESRENSSEEKAADDRPPAGPGPPLTQFGPKINVIFHGRPSEELKEPPKQHEQGRPHPGRPLETSASNEDDLDNSDEENKNSHSAAVEPFSNEMSQEMAKLPRPAIPPAFLRMNSSNEYTYSDEMPGHPPVSQRPTTYSFFNKRPGNEQNGGPPGPPPGSPHLGQSQPPPQTTTQKYSTGFLSYIFGKDNKKQRRPMIPGAPGNHPPSPTQEEMNLNISEEDAADDDDSSEEDKHVKHTVAGPEGKYEVGHLGNKRPPLSFTPDFKPPQKPLRPYRGSTSMEDSDEKRGRSTPHPPTTEQTTPAPPKPLILFGSPYRNMIPPPATPPQHTESPPPPPEIEPVSTKNPKKDSDEDDEPESEEEKASEESKEDDNNSSEEKSGKKRLKKKTAKQPNVGGVSKRKPVKNVVSLQHAPNFHPGSSARPSLSSTTTKPVASKSGGNKNRAGHEDTSDEKQDDSNQTKEEDSEETKMSKEARSDEDSEQVGSSEENNKKEQPPRPQKPKRKPEDDELDHPSAQFPPQPSVVGDIAAIEEILGVPPEENTEDEPVPYGAEDIPAPPPLALQSPFAPSLEIVVPTKAPIPVQPPPGAPLQQFYQSQGNPLAGPNPGVAPGLQQQPAPVNPTSLLGLAQQAPPNNNPNNPSGGAPSDQYQQGIRNPAGQTSNRGPSTGNRRPGQGQNQNNRRPQQGNQNRPDGNNEDSSEENKTSEEKESSEEKDNKREGGFDEAVESLGHKDDDDDDDLPEKDADKGPPPPPPIFTGSAEQKQKINPFLPRPVTPQTPTYYRPKPGRKEPILKHQLQPNQLLHLHHPQKIQPPPMKQPSPQHHASLVLPMRPSAAANLKPLGSQRPPSSFSVSNLLRPLLPRPMVKRKPLDPKVVQWIRESYGIPDLSGPNRSGLQSETGTKTTTTTTRPPSTKKAEKSKRRKTKIKVKQTSKRKTTTEKPKPYRGSAEKRHSGESTPSTTTTSTTSTVATTTVAWTKSSPTITTTTTTTTSKKPLHPLISSTTTAASTTTPSKVQTSKPLSPSKKIPPDYITEEQEAKMAQALFGSSEEEVGEEEKDSDESEESEDDDDESKIKSRVKTKVGGTKLLITVKTVGNKNKTNALLSQKSNKPNKNLSKETGKRSSGEKIKDDSRKSGASEASRHKKTTSTTINPKFELKIRTTPKPKHVKLPPIYGKHGRRTG